MWTFGNSDTSVEFAPEYTWESSGIFTVELIVNDNTGCLEEDVTSIQIEVLPGVNPTIDPVEPLCEGETTQLWGNGTENMYWLPDPTLSDPSVNNPIASPETTTIYYLVDSNECETDTASITVEFINVNTSTGPDQVICIGGSCFLEAGGGADYSWEPPGPLDNSGSDNPLATPIESTMFYVTITTPENCEVLDSVFVQVDQNPPGGNIYPDIALCEGNTVALLAEDGMSWLWSPSNTLDDPTSQVPVASPTDTTTYFVTITNACGEGTDQVTINIIVPEAYAGDDGTVCLGQWHPVWAEGGETYYWTPPQYAANPTDANTSVSPSESMNMVVYVTDEYGCTATDEVFVNVLPLPDVDAGPDRKIDWMDTAHLFGYAEGIEYWWTPDQWIECTDCLYPEIQPDESLYYYLHTIDENGCVGVDSAHVEVFFPLYVPNTITADGDGLNEVFRAYGDNIQGFHMEIYNRWGEMIFESDDINQVWDGRVRDGEHYVQIDTYVWMIWFDALEGRRQLMGHVNVIR